MLKFIESLIISLKTPLYQANYSQNTTIKAAFSSRFEINEQVAKF
ncbi:hypothetical protein NBC122_02374 [Chryseobacterium salivictor]|uniref:Uncharacterized protein n=1 Tax=Chryseobacterium salivictor TaxID=2547600 RepID=A0A4P6ZHX2_9FLAO|nr:hypothetical protein NBC122_02374 [Chryseobacterium salivictor]